MSAKNGRTHGSLTGLRVLDLTRVWAGPLATRIYGDYGADIIKISDPRVPLLSPNGLNSKLNRNKKNIGLRLDNVKIGFGCYCCRRRSRETKLWR